MTEIKSPQARIRELEKRNAKNPSHENLWQIKAHESDIAWLLAQLKEAEEKLVEVTFPVGWGMTPTKSKVLFFEDFDELRRRIEG